MSEQWTSFECRQFQGAYARMVDTVASKQDELTRLRAEQATLGAEVNSLLGDLGRAKTALQLIATCEKVVDGDVVDIARRALADLESEGEG